MALHHEQPLIKATAAGARSTQVSRNLILMATTSSWNTDFCVPPVPPIAPGAVSMNTVGSVVTMNSGAASAIDANPFDATAAIVFAGSVEHGRASLMSILAFRDAACLKLASNMMGLLPLTAFTAAVMLEISSTAASDGMELVEAVSGVMPANIPAGVVEVAAALLNNVVSILKPKLSPSAVLTISSADGNEYSKISRDNTTIYYLQMT
jgi:hypothetical protein